MNLARRQIIIRVLLGLCVATFFSCAGNPKPHIQRFAGHWISGACYSNFTLDGSGEVYGIYYDKLPREVQDFFLSQRSYPTAASESGDETSIYVVLDGYLTPCIYSSCEEIHVQRILRFEPAHKDFIASRKDQTH